MCWDYPAGAIAPRWLSTCGTTIPTLDIDYFFTDTGKELPEVYEFLVKLEGFLGQTHQTVEPGQGF